MNQSLKNYLNNKGVTLIELLAAVTILTIIVLFFVSIFAQTMVFSDKVEDTLTSINLAEKVINDVKTSTANYTGATKVINGETYQAIVPVALNGKTYYPYVLITPETPAILQLEKICVRIYAINDYNEIDNPSPYTEVFGYIDSEV